MKKLLSCVIVTLFFLGFSKVLVNANEYIPLSHNYIQDVISEYRNEDDKHYVIIKDFIRVEPSYVYTILSYTQEVELIEATFYEYDLTKTLIGKVRTSVYSDDRICLHPGPQTKYVIGRFEYTGDVLPSREQSFCMYKGEGRYSDFSKIDVTDKGFIQTFLYCGSNVSGEYYTTVDNPTHPDIIKNAIKVIDNYDGNITANLVTTLDTYTENMNKVGEYKLKYEIADSSNNKSQLELKIIVKDIIAPVISGQKVYTYEPTDNVTIDDLKAQLSVSDNYYEISSDAITVKTDGLTGNENKLGEYSVVYEARDEAGNVGSMDVRVRIKDSTAPTISGQESITVGVDGNLTESDFIELFTAEDSFEGDVTDSIEIVQNGYTGYEKKVGTYEVKVKATDSSGNESTKTLQVKVIDNEPPIFYITDLVVNIQTHQNISEQMLIATVAKRYNVERYEKAEVTYNEYDQFYSSGKYRVLVKLDDKEYELFLNAVDDLYDEVSEEKTTFLEKLWVKLKEFVDWVKKTISEWM